MSSWLVNWIARESARQREEEFREALRRPDALPLPPEEPTPSLGDRLGRVANGWRSHVPARASAAPARRRGDDRLSTR